MSTRKQSGISADEYKALLGHVSARRAEKVSEQAEPVAAPRHSTTDFTTLPGYRELQQQKAVANLIGLQNPFFRIHEGRAAVETQIGGRSYDNFASYDYLGLNGHPEVANAAKAAIDQYGISASASRVVAGERPIHRVLEKEIADLYGAEDCVVMVSGHATNVTTIAALTGPKDIIIHDALAHNSIIMGAKLSGAERRSFPHNDLASLDALLGSIRRGFERVLIVVEGVYSMDGDIPDLPRLLEIKHRHNAWLMVDEAHALGVLGARGFGIAEHFGVNPSEVDLWMGTLSKTLAGCGGYIAGRASLVDYLKCTAGGFVYSVGMAPAIAAASLAALGILKREPERVQRLAQNGDLFVQCARTSGLNVGTSVGRAIIPVITGDSLRASLLGHKLFESGINVLPIIHPAVPERAARLRFFVTAEHTAEQIRRAVALTAEQFALVPSSSSILGQIAGMHR